MSKIKDTPLQYVESMFYSFQSDRTKIGGMSRNTSYYLTWPIFGLWPHLNESLQLRNGGSVTQTNYIYWILSAKGFRGWWVLAPKIFPVEHFRVQSISPKKWLISRLISNATRKTFPGTQKLSLCHRGFRTLPSSIITRSLKTIFNAHNCSRGCSLH